MVIPTISKLKVDKVAGSSVVSKLLKTSTATAATSVAEFANTTTRNFDIPFDWEDISITKIYKGKGDSE